MKINHLIYTCQEKINYEVSSSGKTLTFLFCPDVTAVCILEAFQNQQSMLLADKVLKQLGKEKAKEKYKVRFF